MIKYPITLREAMRCTMAQVPAAGVKFDNPALDQFFQDKNQGLCTIQVKRFIHGMIGAPEAHELWIAYTDPELEVMRRLES